MINFFLFSVSSLAIGPLASLLHYVGRVSYLIKCGVDKQYVQKVLVPSNDRDDDDSHNNHNIMIVGRSLIIDTRH